MESRTGIALLLLFATARSNGNSNVYTEKNRLETYKFSNRNSIASNIL